MNELKSKAILDQIAEKQRELNREIKERKPVKPPVTKQHSVARKSVLEEEPTKIFTPSLEELMKMAGGKVESLNSQADVQGDYVRSASFVTEAQRLRM